MEPLLHGMLLAFGLILPLGVQNIFVFTQGVSQPSLAKALPATITAAISDTVLILLAIFGLSLIVLQFEWLRIVLLVGGILFLMYMGKVIWASPAADIAGETALPIKKQIVFALSVSLLNPHALLDTIGVIGTSAVKYNGQEQAMFAVACIVVSWIWFFGLAIFGATLKKINIPTGIFILFNKCSAVFIWCTALYLFIGLF
ncbi:LysE/ArgO family amino acid transporter [Ureibacillus sinduriensis]|uniref:LysE family L-lysine exporter n=1 Tax=Ureibacillus sinduriensis BLB-1 = JCM 15800 TaxID=1384057 RepID=A0A0A3HSQ1_9BACL|nr:LysE family transporter [Ureibacillus sinduriensis]KGR75631.1 LysE family L-lysine exporter [Ureibacillus sinduriensis BLB-1 = JCM 15800]